MKGSRLRYRAQGLALAATIFCCGALPAPQGARGSIAIDWSAAARATPLDADEEASPAALQLARQFNPAMALPLADGPWPVAVNYIWSAGADLRARVLSPDKVPLSDTVAVPNAQLVAGPWDNLPDHDRLGRRIEYWMDVPGDDRLEGGISGWRRQWSQLIGAAGAASPQQSPFPPTQYVHLFWLNRARGLLAIQYWFYFPFNEWINHHEGDWEHVNVVLEGPSQLRPGAAFQPVGYEFYFHGWRANPDRVVRVTDSRGAGDHVMVYVGGEGRFLFWSGSQSGGSYPLPASFRGVGAGVGSLRAAEDTRRPARFLPADAFTLVMLPEPGRLDTRARPDLSWLKLPFFAGSHRSYRNPPLLDRFGGGRAPSQPAQRADWNGMGTQPLWNGTPVLDTRAPTVPATWSVLPAATPAKVHMANRLADLVTAADGRRPRAP